MLISSAHSCSFQRHLLQEISVEKAPFLPVLLSPSFSWNYGQSGEEKWAFSHSSELLIVDLPCLGKGLGCPTGFTPREFQGVLLLPGLEFAPGFSLELPPHLVKPFRFIVPESQGLPLFYQNSRVFLFILSDFQGFPLFYQNFQGFHLFPWRNPGIGVAGIEPLVGGDRAKPVVGFRATKCLCVQNFANKILVTGWFPLV